MQRLFHHAPPDLSFPVWWLENDSHLLLSEMVTCFLKSSKLMLREARRIVKDSEITIGGDHISDNMGIFST